MKIRYAARKFDSFEKALETQSRYFKSLYPGWDVDIDFYEVEDLYDVIRDGAGDYDAVMCSTDWLPEFIRMSKLRSLNPFFNDLPIDGWPEDWTASLRAPQMDQEGNCYGVAYHDGPMMFYYRKDLFEDTSERDTFQKKFGRSLSIPNTWDEFVEVALHFTRPEKGQFGTVIGAYPDGHNIVFDFLLQLWSRGGELFDKAGEPAFHFKKGLESLQFLVDLIHVHKVVPPNVFDLDSIRAGEFYYRDGQAAMTWNWSHIAACAELPELSSIVGKNGWNFIPMGSDGEARRASIISYYVNAVTCTSKNPRMAYRFVQALSAKKMDLVTTFEGGIGTRLSTWRNPEVLHQFPFFSAIERIHSHARSTPPMVEFPAVNEILNETIDAALHLKGDVGELLAKAATEVRRLF